MSGWFFLTSAAIAEIAFATLLPMSQALTRPWPTLATLMAGGTSLWMLSRAMLSIPPPIAYAIWVGCGAAGAVAASYLSGALKPSPMQIACIGLIVAATFGLKATS